MADENTKKKVFFVLVVAFRDRDRSVTGAAVTE
jgi:hypothetical protein